MTRIVLKNDSLVLPKLIDLSSNLKLKPLNKKSIKTIIKLHEEMTSPMKYSIKNMKKKLSQNYKLSRTTLSNELLSEKLNSKYKLKIVTSDDFLLTQRKKDKKEEVKNKYKTIISNSHRPIKLKKVKLKIKEIPSISLPIKLIPKSCNFNFNSRNYTERRNHILNSKKTSYTENRLTSENFYNNNNNKIISEFTPLEYNLKDEEDIDEEILYEQKDSFNDRDLEETYILKVVTDFLRSKDNKLNQVTINEKFYNSFENRINFIYDIIGVPCFKNHFIKFNPNKDLIIENISNNLVESGIHYYLNKLRVRYQREQDEKEEKRKLELMKEEYFRNLKAKKEKEKMDEFENAEAAFKEIYKKPKVVEISKEIDYDTEDFFSLKFIRFEKVTFSGEKERNAISQKYKKKSKYRYSILDKIVNPLKH